MERPNSDGGHVNRGAVLVVAGLLASCGSDARAPVAPAPTPPTSPTVYVVSGTVRDADGAPLEGATVRVGGDAFGARQGVPQFQTPTDAAGTYQGSLPGGTYVASSSKAGYETSAAMTVQVSGPTVVNFTLRPGISVGGLITEAGVGPLNDATVDVISGPSQGLSTLTGHPNPGVYYFPHVLPGDLTLRVSKTGYDTVEQAVHATASVNLDFTLKWSYGTCLQSVTPVMFPPYPSAGGSGTVVVNASAGRSWSAVPDSAWIQLVSPANQTGPGNAAFTILSNPSSVTGRSGALMIRCSTSEGQNVWISQIANCQVTAQPTSDTPPIFPSEGGIGHLLVHVTTPGCFWTAASQVDWIFLTGAGTNGVAGDGQITFGVRGNGSGAERTGTILLGDTAWQVRQH
jgi:hypothetical protein